MGLMDAFTADARVEFKVGELYDILRVAASNEKTAAFLKNAVECEVPYNYIREMITGKKEEPKEDTFRIEIPRGILEAQAIGAQVREAMKDLKNMTEFERMAAGQKEPNEGLKDCADENVSCEECPKKDFCDAIAEDVAGMAEENGEESGDGE